MKKILAIIAALTVALVAFATPAQANDDDVRFNLMLAKMAWTAAGITTLMWITTGSSTCPYCSSMDGRIVGIEKNFLDQGDGIDDMKPSTSIGHPPLHAGCDCMIVPGS